MTVKYNIDDRVKQIDIEVKETYKIIGSDEIFTRNFIKKEYDCSLDDKLLYVKHIDLLSQYFLKDEIKNAIKKSGLTLIDLATYLSLTTKIDDKDFENNFLKNYLKYSVEIKEDITYKNSIKYVVIKEITTYFIPSACKEGLIIETLFLDKFDISLVNKFIYCHDSDITIHLHSGISYKLGNNLYEDVSIMISLKSLLNNDLINIKKSNIAYIEKYPYDLSKEDKLKYKKSLDRTLDFFKRKLSIH